MKRKKKMITTNPRPQAGGFFLAKRPLALAQKASKDLLGLKETSRERIVEILQISQNYKERLQSQQKKGDELRGKTLMNLFFEPSTRTRVSFELAAKNLSAELMNMSPATSSLSKGESLKDMIANLEAMNPHIMVVRHAVSGVPGFIARNTRAAVINAGDGSHEHPTQGLLDLFTVKEKLGEIKGLHLVIVGDIAYSRVARSNIYGFTKLGAKITVVGPATLIPPGLDQLGVKVGHDLDQCLPHADVVMLLRIQKERQETLNFPSLTEYSRFFGLTKERRARMNPKAIIMHPGPINRGIEIDPDVADNIGAEQGPQSVILNQVHNGTAVRMAVLALYGANS